jgi:hypothetical protein
MNIIIIVINEFFLINNYLNIIPEWSKKGKNWFGIGSIEVGK